MERQESGHVVVFNAMTAYPWNGGTHNAPRQGLSNATMLSVIKLFKKLHSNRAILAGIRRPVNRERTASPTFYVTQSFHANKISAVSIKMLLDAAASN